MIEKISRQVRRAFSRETEIKTKKILEIHITEKEDVIIYGSLPPREADQYNLIGKIVISLSDMVTQIRKNIDKPSIVKPGITR